MPRGDGAIAIARGSLATRLDAARLDGATPCVIAAQQGHVATVRLPIKYGATAEVRGGGVVVVVVATELPQRAVTASGGAGGGRGVRVLDCRPPRPRHSARVG